MTGYSMLVLYLYCSRLTVAKNIYDYVVAAGSDGVTRIVLLQIKY